MRSLALLFLPLAACATATPIQSTPEYSPSATAPDLRPLYEASPLVVPVRTKGAYGTTLQLALTLGFSVVHTDASAGLLVIARTERDDYENDADSRGYLHTRKLTLTIAIDGRTATLSPAVTSCAEASCAPSMG